MSDGREVETVKPVETADRVQESAESPAVNALELLQEGVPSTSDQTNTPLKNENQLVADGVLADLTIDGLEDKNTAPQTETREHDQAPWRQARQARGRQDFSRSESEEAGAGDDNSRQPREARGRPGVDHSARQDAEKPAEAWRQPRERQGRQDYSQGDDSPLGRIERTTGRRLNRTIDRAGDIGNIFNGKGEIDLKRAERNYKDILGDLGKSVRRGGR